MGLIASGREEGNAYIGARRICRAPVSKQMAHVFLLAPGDIRLTIPTVMADKFAQSGIL